MPRATRAISRSWNLEPERHEAPECRDYRDAAEVFRFEQEMRVYRAFSERYVVTALDGRVDGAYRVEGASGQGRLVDIADASGRHDGCGCPDFLTNELGTCKHLEAVRRGIGERRAQRQALLQVGNSPPQPTLIVDGVGGLAVRIAGPRGARFAKRLGLELDEEGRLQARGEIDLSAGVEGRIAHAAPAVLRMLRERRAITERRAEVLAAHAEGRLRLDVLREALFPYQEDGVLHLAAGGRALLADDMGLGKTVQAIAACEVLRARGEARRILVVTPASLKDQWAREVKRYTGSSAVVVSGGADKRHAALGADAAYTIINYELTWRDLSLLSAFQPDILVLDEAQRAKNFRTKTAATLRAMPSRFLFVLTGTPIENRLDDLYSLLQLVDGGLLGPLWRFNLRFHDQNERGKIVGYRGLAELRSAIAPAVLRRRKEDVLTQLPPLTEQTRHVPISPKQVELEEHYRTEAAKLLATAERRALRPEEQQRLMAMLLKARQACSAAELCDPKLVGERSPKLDELEQIVGEVVEQGAGKILIFSEWTQMLRLAAARLDEMGVGWEMLHGGVPTDKRPALLDVFRNHPDKRVLLSTDAGGVGLNLQVASYVVHLDLPWNPGRLDQRTARAHRLGQTRGVSATYLVAERGIERGIEGTLAGKRALRGAALDAKSEVDSLEAPSFSIFMRELRDVMTRMESEGEEPADVVAATGAPQSHPVAEVAIVPDSDALLLMDMTTAEAATLLSDGASAEENVAAASAGSEALAPSAAGPSTLISDAAIPNDAAAPDPQAVLAPPSGFPPSSARNGAPDGRLRLAAIVLAAGFPGDAVRAAYEGLAGAVRALLPAPVADGHSALVAAIYRDLAPTGRIPPAFHGALSRLNDLSQLESHGVAVEHSLAAEVVADAGQWIARLAPREGDG